jgi:ketosteroid isomerase-like protein
METSSYQKTITDFAAAINSHDLEKIAALMDEGHTFIDAHGIEMRGKEIIRDGWGNYFHLFPDYYIGIEEIVTEGDLALAYGFAGAGTGEKAWKIPAAWRAIVRDGKIKLWQVYADTKIQFERMKT